MGEKQRSPADPSTNRSNDGSNDGSIKGSPDLPLPHERDQDAGQGDKKPRRRIEQAKRDLDRGLEDTDCYGRVNSDRRPDRR